MASPQATPSYLGERTPALIFNPEPVKSDHWAAEYLTRSNPNFIAQFRWQGYQIVVKINPSDARGYRVIAVLQSFDMTTTLNRCYTPLERMAVLESAIDRMGLIPQSETAGNNSQQVDPATGQLKIGYKEPSMLHGHVISRGDVNYEYIAGQKLNGPPLGQLFNMRGDSKLPVDYKQGDPIPQELIGNLQKEKWVNKKAVVEAFSTKIREVMEAFPEYKNMGLKLLSIASNSISPNSNIET